MSVESIWPLVDPNDDGIRPAGAPDKCFYCRQKVGTPHGRDCVTVSKRVRVRYTIELEIDVPYSWDQEMIEFQRNESSWCASNCVDDITEYIEAIERDVPGTDGRLTEGCLCEGFKCEYLGVTDHLPRRELREPEVPA